MGLSLAGGTVSYRGNGAFDAESATAEAFVRGRATSPDANVIAFAAANDLSAPVWAVSAGGTVTVRTAAGGRTFALSETLADGTWHHLAVSYAPAGGDTAVKVWVDYDCAIDATAFDGCPETLVIFAPAGGATESWAQANGAYFHDADIPYPVN